MEIPIFIWFLVFARAGALIAVFPLFSAQTTPVQLRIALAACIATLTAPFLPSMTTPDSFLTVMGYLFQEISVGLLLGFVSRLVFFALDLAGGIIATEMGLMLSTNFNPLTSSALPVPGTILFWFGMMLLLSLNLHHWIIGAFQHTYAFVPVGGAHLSEALLMEVLRGTAEIFRVAVIMTAPVMAVSFVITLIFAVLSRAVPQMNVFSESFPVKCLAGLAVFGLTCHLMAQHIENYLRRLPDDLVRIGQLLGGT